MVATTGKRTHPTTTVEHVQALVDYFNGDTNRAALAAAVVPGTINHALSNGIVSVRISNLCQRALHAIRLEDQVRAQAPVPVAAQDPDTGDSLVMVSVPFGKMDKFRTAMSFLGFNYLES